MSIAPTSVEFRPLAFLLALAVAASPALSQTASISGVVRDSEGRPLDGARIEATGVTGESATTRSDVEGRFAFAGLSNGTYSVRVARIGARAWSSDSVRVVPGEVTTLSVTLTSLANQLNPVVVTVSRHQEKALDAPASIAVISAGTIEKQSTLTPVENVASVPGVDIARTGLMQSSIVTRGFNDVFSGSLLFLTDNRYDFVPSLRVNAPWLLPTPNADIERIEVVLGPAAALYGPNAAEGVLHIITKSPFDEQSTTLSISGVGRGSNGAGSSGALGRGTLRRSGLLGHKVGYKFAAEYSRGTDWSSQDSAEVAARLAAIAAGALPDTLHTGRRDFNLRKWNAEGRVDFRPTDASEIIVGAGRTNAGSAIELTGLGAAQVRDWTFDYYHIRARDGRLFGQAFLNSSNAGHTYLLRTGQPVVDRSRMFVGQLQHSFNAGTRETITYGVDAQYTEPRTEGTITGRNEDHDDISEWGGYVHTQTRLSPQFELTAAGRIDEHNRLPHPVVSPRVGLVYKPSDNHTFRLTYNRAFETPGTNSLFLDVVAGSLSPLPFNVRAMGVPPGGLAFRHDCDGGLCMRTPLGNPTQGLPVDGTLVWSSLVTALRNAGGPDLTNIPAPTAADVRSVLRVLDPFALTFTDVPASAVGDIPELRETLTRTLEAGYKGVVSDRLSLNTSIYYERKNNFIGPLAVATPSVFLDAGTLAAYLGRYMQPAQAQQAALLIGGASGSPLAHGIPVGTVVPESALTNSPDIVLTYRNFGAIHRWGADAGFDITLSDLFSLSGSYSYSARNLFPKEEVGGLSDIALNAPRNKGTLGIHFSDDATGLSASLTGRRVGGFPMNSGVYVGSVPGYSVADVQCAYKIRGSDMFISANVANLFDSRHREFVGAPILGRFAILQAQYTLH